MQELTDSIVLITGANRGIGLAATQRFLDEGAIVVATARDTTSLRPLAQRLGGRLELEVCDVTDDASVNAMARTVTSRHDRIDVLINNAGIFIAADREMPADALDPTVLQRTLDVNLFGVTRVCTAFARHMRRGGRIVNVSSRMGQLDDGLGETSVAYSVSKTALNAYTSALSAAMHGRDVLVDAMHPGWVKTDMGGAGAHLEPRDATDTMVYLATRKPNGETGLFWFNSEVIPW